MPVGQSVAVVNARLFGADHSPAAVQTAASDALVWFSLAVRVDGVGACEGAMSSDLMLPPGFE